MGTDINIAIERWDRTAKCWRGDGILEHGRNPAAFQLLALGHATSDVKPIVEARGFPTDMHPMTCTCRQEDRAHCALPYKEDEFGWGASWLTLDELVAYDWATPIRLAVDIPLRHVDCGDGRSSHPFDIYEEWSKQAPRAPVLADMEARLANRRLVLDLCTLGGLGSKEGFFGTRRREDRKLAEELLTDHSKMPPPEEPPPGAVFTDQTGGAYGWERGRLYPRVAYARVDWQEPASGVCAQLYAWVTAEVARGSEGDEVRIIYGFS